MASDAKADGAEVTFDGGERSGTRYANSSITANLVQYDRQVGITARVGQKSGTSSTREFDDESLKAMVDEAIDAAKKARDNPNLPPLVKGPQNYVARGRRRARDRRFRPGRARRLGEEVCRHLRKERRRSAPATSRRRTRRPASRTRKGCSRITSTPKPDSSSPAGCRADRARAGRASPASRTLARSIVAHLTEVAADKALKSQKPRAIEPGRYTTILEPRPAARFLSR